jgi:5-formyltetrahydrofolate cyclo-ligase
MQKGVLRRTALERRAEAFRTLGEAAPMAVRNGILGMVLPTASIIAGYWPMRDELDPRPTLLGLGQRGHGLALPVVAARNAPLVFRRWHMGAPLAPDVLGLDAPSATAEAVIPDVLLVPLVAFDRRGHRLGYGAGFYDRTLFALREQKDVVAIGLGFAAQELAEIPVDGNDQPLDGIVTEREFLWLRQRGIGWSTERNGEP